MWREDYPQGMAVEDITGRWSWSSSILPAQKPSLARCCSVSLCRDHASCPSVPPQIHISSQQLCHRRSHELPPQLKLPALILLLLQFLPRPSLVAGRAAVERPLGWGSGPPWCPPKKRERGAGPASRAGDAFWWSLCLKCVDTLPSRGAAPDRDHGFVGQRNIVPARRASPGTALPNSPSVWQAGPAPASYHNVFSVSGEHVWVRK